jgi:formylglycine-generating enzyme required for sulfatase activity
MIVVLSPASVASDNVMDEVSYALEKSPEKGNLVVPIVHQPCEIPFRLRRIQRIDFTVSYDTGFSRLLQALYVEHSSSAPTPTTPDSPIVEHVEQQRGLEARLTESAPTPTTPDSPIVEHVEQQRGLEARLTNSIGMEFVLIAAGTFLMGSDHGGGDEQPIHQVTISQPFYLGTYAVTQGQWEAVMGTNPSHFTGDRNRPVEQVSWEDTQEFIQRLHTREGGARYRLPTEAEWEYACRAGSQTAYSFGGTPYGVSGTPYGASGTPYGVGGPSLSAYGWYAGNASEGIFALFRSGKTHPVGQRQPNAWGLYDMHGNVWEWVQDWYGNYAPEPVADPQGPASGVYRVFRGGSWYHGARHCRSAYRSHGTPSYRARYLGVRLLRTAR